MNKKKIDPEKEHEQEKKEMADIITAEDVAEQVAYAANAPKCCSKKEQAEHMFNMLGANIIDFSIYHTESEHRVSKTEIDYEAEVKASIAKEFEQFKKEICEQGVEAVFDKSFEINSKTEFCLSLLQDTEYEPWVYKSLYQERGKILENLYDEYVGNPKGSINTTKDTKALVEGYCEKYYSDVHEEFELENEEGNQEQSIGGM